MQKLKAVCLSGFVLLSLSVAGCSNVQKHRDEVDNFKTKDINIDELKKSARTADEYGHDTEAFIHYSQVLQLEPADREANLGIAHLYLDNDDTENAIKHFNRILDDNPDDIEAQEGRATAWLKSRDFDKAKVAYTSIVENQPDRWKSWEGLGIISDIAGEYDKSKEMYEKAIAVHSGDAKLLNNYGYSRIMAHQYKAAEGLLRKANLIDANSATIRNNFAIAVAWQKRYADAVAILNEDKDSPEAYNNVGYIAYLAGDYPQAINYFEKALTLSPTYYVIAARNLEKARRKLETGTK